MRVNKKMKRGALRSALTDAVRSDKLVVLDDLSFDGPKTKEAGALLDRVGIRQGRILVVVPRPTADGAVEKSFRNIEGVRVTYAGALAVYEVLAADKILLTSRALDVLEGTKEAAAPETDGALASGEEPTADVASVPSDAGTAAEADADEDVAPEDQEVGE